MAFLRRKDTEVSMCFRLIFLRRVFSFRDFFVRSYCATVGLDGATVGPDGATIPCHNSRASTKTICSIVSWSGVDKIDDDEVGWTIVDRSPNKSKNTGSTETWYKDLCTKSGEVWTSLFVVYIFYRGAFHHDHIDLVRLLSILKLVLFQLGLKESDRFRMVRMLDVRLIGRAFDAQDWIGLVKLN